MRIQSLLNNSLFNIGPKNRLSPDYFFLKYFSRCFMFWTYIFFITGTPSGGSSASRPESRADSMTGGWVTSSSTVTPTTTALKCLTPFSISTSNNKRKQGSINLDTFEPTPVNTRPKLESEQKGKTS